MTPTFTVTLFDIHLLPPSLSLWSWNFELCKKPNTKPNKVLQIHRWSRLVSILFLPLFHPFLLLLDFLSFDFFTAFDSSQKLLHLVITSFYLRTVANRIILWSNQLICVKNYVFWIFFFLGKFFGVFNSFIELSLLCIVGLCSMID